MIFNKKNKCISITEFLAAFFENERQTVTLATLVPKGGDGYANFYRTNCATFANDYGLQRRLKLDNQTKGVYFFVNSGGTKDQSITKFNAFFVENDDLSIPEQHRALDNAPIQPSIRVETKKSVHAFWLISADCSELDWREIQERLIAFFNSDKKIKNPARCMRLPFFKHVSFDGTDYNYKTVELVTFNAEQRFTVEEMKNAFPFPEVLDTTQTPLVPTIKKPQNSLNSYDLDLPATAKIPVLPSANSLSSLNSSQLENKSVVQRAVETIIEDKQKSFLRRPCFHGLAGEIVRIIEPHTEADPMALLLNTLVAFGNVIGRKAFFEADGAQHFTNLFGVLVGSTSAGKGTSWSQIKRLFAKIDKDWSKNQIQSGLSSGEGLIAAVKEDENAPKDKRLLVVESEFSSVLSMNKREGNTLSPIIRGFWDDGSAQTMTKNTPMSVIDAHISILGHITPFELKSCLRKTEIANGFANRFLWLQINRSKILPEGGKVPAEDLDRLTIKLSKAIEYAKTVEEVERDYRARKLWCRNYRKLTSERNGAFGSAIARARAQVVRLSLIYALMDKSNVITIEHLEAALDFWNCCEKSANQIFGESTGDKLADTIHRHLKSSKQGLSKTDIFKKTNNNYSSDQIDKALLILSTGGLIYSHDEKRDNSSNFVEIWYSYEVNEFNESEDDSKDSSDLENLEMPLGK